MNTKINIADHAVLQHPAAARGVARRVLETAREITHSRSYVDVINAAVGPRAPLGNPKGRSRIIKRLVANFGPRLMGYTSSDKPPSVDVSFWHARPDHGIDFVLATIDAERGGSWVRTYSVGSMTDHALARFIQRVPETGDDTPAQATAAASRAATIVSSAKIHGAFDNIPQGALVMVPVGYGLVALVDSWTSAVVTFVNEAKLGPARSAALAAIGLPEVITSPVGGAVLSAYAMRQNLLPDGCAERIAATAAVLAATRRHGQSLSAIEAELYGEVAA